MTKLILTYVILLIALTSINAQKKTLTLSKQELKEYEKKASKLFSKYENYMVNLLDRNSDELDRLYSKNALNRLFDSGANIQDDFFTPNIRNNMRKDLYFETLDKLSRERVNISKNLKPSDDIKVDFESGPTSLGVNIEEKGSQFTIYKAELYFQDYFTISETIEEIEGLSPNNISTKGRKMLKKMKIEIRYTLTDGWTMFIKRITIVNKGLLEYQDNKSGVRKSTELTTKDKLKKNQIITDVEKLSNLTPFEIIKIKEIKDSIKINPPIVASLTDSIYYSPTLTDYLLPGKGHLKFNKKFKRYAPAIIYTAGALGTVVPAIVFKVRSDKAYNDHKVSTTYKEKDETYKNANNEHHKFLLFTGGAAAIWSINAAHLFIKDKIQKHRYYDENIFEKKVSLQLTPSSTNLGIGLSLNF